MLKDVKSEEIESILNDKKSGCSEILLASLNLLSKIEKNERERGEKIAEIVEKIVNAHKGMEGLANVLKRAVLEGVDVVRREVEEANKKTAKKLSELVCGKTVVTISKSGILENGLQKASKVYVLISRPGEEGRLMAERLKQFTSVKLVEDAEMGVYVRMSDVVVSGADAICHSGFVNKVGTLPLMLTAKHFGVRRLVATPTYKLVNSPRSIHPFEFVDSQLAELVTEKGLSSWNLPAINLPYSKSHFK